MTIFVMTIIFSYSDTASLKSLIIFCTIVAVQGGHTFTWCPNW